MVTETNCVTVRIWRRNVFKNRIGHVSLETPNRYISLWPKGTPSNNITEYFEVRAGKIINNYSEDIRLEDGEKADEIYQFYSLDVAAIENKFNFIIADDRVFTPEDKPNIAIVHNGILLGILPGDNKVSNYDATTNSNNLKWTLPGKSIAGTICCTEFNGGNAHNCASLVRVCLDAGGFINLCSANISSKPIETPNDLITLLRKAQETERKEHPIITTFANKKYIITLNQELSANTISYKENSFLEVEYNISSLFLSWFNLFSKKTVSETTTQIPIPSIFENLSVTDKKWIITLFSENTKNINSHTAILIEGSRNGKYFALRTEVKAEIFADSKGFINHVMIEEFTEKDQIAHYINYYHRSFDNISNIEVEKMLLNIKKDKLISDQYNYKDTEKIVVMQTRINNSKNYEIAYFNNGYEQLKETWQTHGPESNGIYCSPFFRNERKCYNCKTWCYAKLARASINIPQAISLEHIISNINNPSKQSLILSNTLIETKLNKLGDLSC